MKSVQRSVTLLQRTSAFVSGMRMSSMSVPSPRLKMEWVAEGDLYKPLIPKLESDPRTGWTQESRRCGILAQKVGMMSSWNEYFEHVPVTVLRVPECRVIQIKRDERTKPGYIALQIGAQPAREKHLTKPLLGHFAAANVTPMRKLTEFTVTEDALLPVGQQLFVEHFVPGQCVDVQGTSKGKGFQGGMKRHGFSGNRASHGNSLSHRSIGSTGSNQSPGRVFKGKKMPGRMGGDTVTMQNLTIWAIDIEENMLMIKGHIPGAAGTWVRVSDAIRKDFEIAPPFPTWDSESYGAREDMPPFIVSESKKPIWFEALEAEREEARQRGETLANIVIPEKEEDIDAGLFALKHYFSYPLLTRVLPQFYRKREAVAVSPIADGHDHAEWAEFLKKYWTHRQAFDDNGKLTKAELLNVNRVIKSPMQSSSGPAAPSPAPKAGGKSGGGKKK